MSGIRDHDLLRIRNVSRERICRRRDEWRLVVADDDEGRHLYVREVGYPDRGHASGFGMRIEQVLARIGRPQSAIAIGDVIPSRRDPCDWTRQKQLAHRIEAVLFRYARKRAEQLADLRRRGKTLRERAVKNEPSYPIWIRVRESESDAASARMPDNKSSLHVQCFQEHEQIMWLSALIREPGRPPESARVVTYHLITRLERRNLIVPDAYVVGPTVNEHNSRSTPGDLVVDASSAPNIEGARLSTGKALRQHQQNQEQHNPSHCRLLNQSNVELSGFSSQSAVSVPIRS